ncbi:MAG: hypothetical protein ACLSVG_02980 [Clostridia bacterium]
MFLNEAIHPVKGRNGIGQQTAFFSIAGGAESGKSEKDRDDA